MKRFIAFFLAALIALSVCACGETNTSSTFTVHAYVPQDWDSVHMWAWSEAKEKDAFDAWPGNTMAPDANGWYTCQIPSWVDSIIVNGNEGNVQTADISVESKELWIVVYADLSYEISYDGPIEVPQTTTVFAYIPEDWANPSCWAWSEADDVNAFDAWPGEAMTQNGEWYTVEVPNWVDHVIINGNSGEVQTADLPIEPGKDIWVVTLSADNSTVFYSEPSDEEWPVLEHQFFWEASDEDFNKMIGTCTLCGETTEETVDWELVAPSFILGTWVGLKVQENGIFHELNEGITLEVREDGTATLNMPDEKFELTWKLLEAKPYGEGTEIEILGFQIMDDEGGEYLLAVTYSFGSSNDHIYFYLGDMIMVLGPQ